MTWIFVRCYIYVNKFSVIENRHSVLFKFRKQEVHTCPVHIVISDSLCRSHKVSCRIQISLRTFTSVYLEPWLWLLRNFMTNTQRGGNLVTSVYCTTLRFSFLFSDIDECSPNPCKNDGDCVQTFNASYLCGCKAGYTGVNCTESNCLQHYFCCYYYYFY